MNSILDRVEIDSSLKNPMDIKELKRIMKMLGCYGHNDLAELIGVSRSAVTVWLHEYKNGPPKPICILLRLLAS